MTSDQSVPSDSLPVSVNRGRLSPMGRLPGILEKRGVVGWILAGVLVAAAALYVGLLRPASFGAYHDDGMYVVLAKALATGHGYKVISLPLEPDQTKSPPLFPFVLSLIWKLYPQFPQNVTLMMLLSALATVMFLALSWRYLVRQGYAGQGQALIIVTLAALNWRTIILATGVYSEMLYGLLSVGTLYLAEKNEKERIRSIGGVVLGLVMGLAFLVRSSAIALPVSVVAYYLLKKRWRNALIPASIAAVFVLGWLVWGYFHRPLTDSANAGYYESYLSTLTQVVAGGEGIGSKLSSLFGLITQNGFMLIFVTAPVVTLGLGYEWTQNVPGILMAIGFVLFAMTFMFILGGFFRFRKTGFRLLHAYVAVYVLIHMLWPYAAYDRFLMPLLPWMLLFLTSELKLLATSARKELTANTAITKKLSAALMSVVLLLLGGFAVYNVQAGIRTLWSSGKEKSRFLEDNEAIRWLKANATHSDVIVCYRDPTYYLHTGRKAIRSISAREGGLTQESSAAPDEQVKVIFRIIAESNARYLVVTSTDYEQEDQADLQRASLKSLIDQNPLRFIVVFESTTGGSRIYRIEDGNT